MKAAGAAYRDKAVAGTHREPKLNLRWWEVERARSSGQCERVTAQSSRRSRRKDSTFFSAHKTPFQTLALISSLQQVAAPLSSSLPRRPVLTQKHSPSATLSGAHTPSVDDAPCVYF